MHYGPLVTKILLSFMLSTSVLFRYGNWFRHHIIVTLVVQLAWFFSFLIIFALPLDVISTVFRQCVEENVHLNATIDPNSTTPTPITCEEPWSNVPESIFPNLWRTVYWTMQCLTWLFMPMMQSYIKAGDFTIKGKLKSALIDNAIYYGSYLFICGILLIYLATRPGIDIFEWSKLKAIASSASNTWGLFLLVLLLGYALVAVPRNLWNNSNQSYVLNHAYFKAAKLSADKAEAEEIVDDVLESLQAISLAVRPGHALHQNLETIIQKVPSELKDRMNRRQLPDDTPTDSPGEKTLIRLHKQVIKSLQVLQRTETQWSILVEKIFALEDTLKNLNSRDRVYKRTFDKPKTVVGRIFYSSTIEWYWKCVFASYMKKMLSVLAGILSVAVVWSEVTFFNKQPVLSIFAYIVNVAKINYDYSTIELMSTLVILYLCYCAYSTVLKIRVLNLYYLAPHHQTNEYSLIFSGMMLSRLTPPLCLNFLGLIHMDSHIIKKQVLETHYTQIMGHMDVIKIISDGFNIYFPMAILFFCVATYFSLGARLLSAVGFHQFIGDDEITTDLVNEGRDLIKREKRKRQRAEEAMMRRREFHERFPPSGRLRTRGSTDTIRTVRNDDTQESTLLPGRNLDYEGTREEVDTRFPPDLADDIDARFGVSTRNIINERYDSSNELEFSDGYQLDTNYRNRVGIPPRGIFDDV
ncbi:PREDICTED: LMBR1 domain-containing protein 2 homolog isoform X2 [Nicrophorus vespilloides]|uniref:LMBR1 domain-containing protein 2 homolog isoform X2 n=1 Tax=Nicrophorus vespilloides TaxID=110193 RepID=A0ABM1MRA2_NICVS|nr:PREDICTED: LMBR1 domain-containing protein 2 homolog isoform X2 [Nicrophorus vespilloides]